jgi:Vacuolar sorting protein 9 (VPS9) domain
MRKTSAVSGIPLEYRMVQWLNSTSHRYCNTSTKDHLHHVAIMRQSDGQGRETKPLPLPDDFLRLPSDIAVRRYLGDISDSSSSQFKYKYQLVKDLNRRVLFLLSQNCGGDGYNDNCHHQQLYTLVLPRHEDDFTLGMSVVVSHGLVRVCSVSDRIRIIRSMESLVVQKGDILRGVNGWIVPEIAPSQLHRLTSIVKFLRTCPSPVVLHLEKRPLHDTTNININMNINDWEATTTSEDGILQGPRGSPNKNKFLPRSSTKALSQITDRARQWQISNSLRVNAKTFQLQTVVASHTTTLTRTPLLWGHGDTTLQNMTRGNYHNNHNHNHKDEDEATTTVLPLVGVRKALSSRILHTFQDGDLSALTIWCHDVESGREWYAPLRYFCDFEDLYHATSNIYDKVAALAFPSSASASSSSSSSTWSTLLGSNNNNIHDHQQHPLEHFLRKLGTMIYTEELQPAVVQVAVHYQSFLGCDHALAGEQTSSLSLMTLEEKEMKNGVHHHGSSWEGLSHNPKQVRTRQALKRSLQMFTYRALLLESIQKLVSQLVNAAASDNSPTLQEMDKMTTDTLKENSKKKLDKIKTAVDQLQEFLLRAFMEDFRAIAHCGLYTCIHAFLGGSRGESYFDRLVREAVREHVEIEVYLPLRCTASRLLVNAWRNHDALFAFKVKALRCRPLPDHYFFIQNDKDLSSSTSDCVSRLLRNVASCALPSSKLTALLDASNEISCMHQYQHPNNNNKKQQTSTLANTLKIADNEKHCGADDFLPMLILCLVQAEIERPFALCALLKGLCDPKNRNGEIGYYLASFEAAITHILEFDLSESGDLWTKLLE